MKLNKSIVLVFAVLAVASGAIAQAPPTITSQSESQILDVGQTASFGVNISSDGVPVSYQWFRNGTAVADADAASITTPPAQLTDNGTVYYCLVSDEWGQTASAGMVLNVVSSQPGAFAMVLNPSNKITTLGTPVSFTLGVVNSTGQLITLGCASSIPNSLCLLSDNQVVQGDLTVQILTGSTTVASIPPVLIISLFLLGSLIGCVCLMSRRVLPAALIVVMAAAGCNQMPVPAPATQPAALSYSFSITGTISTGIQQVAVGTVTIQQAK